MPARPELIKPRRNTTTLKARLGREAVKWALARFLRWSPVEDPEPGYTIILGVPWDLRHLLPVNLRFVSQTDLDECYRIHVVFDRCGRPGAQQLIEDCRASFPKLPLRFSFYPTAAGRIIERVNVSTFYNSMNTTLALGECRTRYAILHDFDLYPLVPDYFRAVVEAMRERDLRFCGLEYTFFEHLTEEDRLLGTWCLGIDVPWLRQTQQPIDCFHRVARVNGRLVSLDPFSWVQMRTARRDLVRSLDGSACCHVNNLCSTYLRFVNRQWARIVWRLHYVWYLEKLAGDGRHFELALQTMEEAQGPVLDIDSYDVDFNGTDPTCANVLRDELRKMETFLFGRSRADVEAYVDAFEGFLHRIAESVARTALVGASN